MTNQSSSNVLSSIELQPLEASSTCSDKALENAGTPRLRLLAYYMLFERLVRNTVSALPDPVMYTAFQSFQVQKLPMSPERDSLTTPDTAMACCAASMHGQDPEGLRMNGANLESGRKIEARKDEENASSVSV